MSEKEDIKGLSRRDFIKGVGITTAGLLAGSFIGGKALAETAATPTLGRVIGANDQINFGVIGVGGMGSGHLVNLLGIQQEQNLKVAAVCDVFKNRREGCAGAAKLSLDNAYSDYRKLLDRKDIDAVVIATPDHWHSTITIAALEAGKHVYVEKPMTRYFKEALKVYDTAKHTGKIIQVGSQGCTDAKWHTAGKLVRDGKIGKVIWAQGSYCRNNPNGEWNYDIDKNVTPETLDWKTWEGSAPKHEFSPQRYHRWRKYWDYGTGIIGDLWPHRLHPLMIALALEEFPKRISCVGSIMCHTDHLPDEPRDVAEATLLQVEFPNGAMIFLAGSTVNERGIEDMIRGQKANLFFGGDKVRIEPERPYSEEIEAADVPVVGPGESHTEHMKNFISCIRNGGVPNCNVDLATRVMAMVAGAEISYRESRMVTYDPNSRKFI